MKTRHKFWGSVYTLIFLILLIKIPKVVFFIIGFFILAYTIISWVGYDYRKKSRSFGDYNLIYLLKTFLQRFNKWLDTFDKK